MGAELAEEILASRPCRPAPEWWLLFDLASFADDYTRQATCGLAYMAGRAKASERTVHQWLTSLHDAGLIRVMENDDPGRIAYTIPPLPPRRTADAESPVRTALYRYYDDTGRLLYIGITGDLSSRENGHVRSSLWMQIVASSTVERHPGREDALAAERLAIETEHPLFNRQYNDTPEARARLKDYLKEIRRMDLHIPWPAARSAAPEEPRVPKAKGKQPRTGTAAVAYHPTDDEIEAECRKDPLYPIVAAGTQDDRLSLRAQFLLVAAASLNLADTNISADDPALAELERLGYYRDGKLIDDLAMLP